jgi:uncharacterized protein with PQ loop repeat
MIQDYILVFVGILFGYSLIPQIIKIFKNKSAKDLSFSFLIITFFGLLTISICFLTLKLYFSALTNIFTAICYFVLIILKIKYRSKND